MVDTMNEMDLRPKPTAERPLLGLTVLVIEDSRFASEAMRLLCLRSGARIRRADCVASAERHLNVYRPSVAIVDLGLPDGSGLELIRRMNGMTPRVPILFGTSGAEREEAERQSLAAGADGFLPKPMDSLAGFQAAILKHLPQDMRPRGPRVVEGVEIHPDPISLREDLSHAVAMLDCGTPPAPYLRRFLLGVARGARDARLEAQAHALSGDMPLEDAGALRAYLSQKIDRLPVAI